MRGRPTLRAAHGGDPARDGEGVAAYQTLESLRSPHVTGIARGLLLLRLETLVARGESSDPPAVRPMSNR